MISIIVPVKNGLSFTRGLFESLTAGNPDVDVQWIIVDSGSTDGTVEFCRDNRLERVEFTSTPFNYCAAVNRGAERARGDVWMIANNDLTFRSQGDLRQIEDVFREWPLLSVLSPGRMDGSQGLEFRIDGVNGACWVVRAASIREWGGMPEQLSGYGYDEAFTAVMCWRRGYLLGWLNGWDVLHHGSATFGPEGGNTTPAMRRNLIRLLQILGHGDLDRPGVSASRLVAQVYERERASAPARLEWIGPQFDVVAQGYVNVATHANPSAKLPRLTVDGAPNRQWAPWAANLLERDPECAAFKWDQVQMECGETGIALAPPAGPAPTELLPPVPEKRPTLRQQISARLHDWRNRRNRLPDGW